MGWEADCCEPSDDGGRRRRRSIRRSGGEKGSGGGQGRGKEGPDVLPMAASVGHRNIDDAGRRRAGAIASDVVWQWGGGGGGGTSSVVIDESKEGLLVAGWREGWTVAAAMRMAAFWSGGGR